MLANFDQPGGQNVGCEHGYGQVTPNAMPIILQRLAAQNQGMDWTDMMTDFLIEQFGLKAKRAGIFVPKTVP